MAQLNKKYLIIATILFIIEIFIAVYVHDDFVRPYIGDLLVVILLYCLVRSFLKISMSIACLSVLLFSYLIETLQYFNFVQLIGLGHSQAANIIIGNYFTWIDIVAYTLGILLVFGIEYVIDMNKRRKFAKCSSTPENLHVFI